MEHPHKIRSTLSLSDLRSRNLSSLLPSGHDKALKYAFYNVIALVLTGLSIVGLWAVYCILEPFIKSLLWALLCGSVLYPFKRKLVETTNGWMSRVKSSKVPFVLQVLSSPVIIADSVSDQIGDYVSNYWKSIGGAFVSFFATYLIYHNPPVTLGLMLQWIISTLYSIVYTVLGCVRSEIVFALIIAYGGLIIHTIMIK